MKALRRLAILALSVGTLVSPFCPMAVRMAHAQERPMEDSAMMMTHESPVEEPVPSCGGTTEDVHHANERRAVIGFVSAAPCIVPDAVSYAVEELSAFPEFCTDRGEANPSKFELRSHIKRE